MSVKPSAPIALPPNGEGIKRPEPTMATTGAVIVVGCKLPHGLVLHLPGMEQTVTLRGLNAAKVIGGYGLTRGVSEDFFDAWLAIHRDHPAVRNGLIFKQSDASRATDQAKEQSGVKSGFEGIDPEKPGRLLERDLRPGEAPTARGSKPADEDDGE